MIGRTYGRRDGSMRRRFDESFSQESPQDVYDFTLSSQGSTRWSSDPYGLNNLSSQGSDELVTLPPGGARENGDFEGFDGSLWKSSKKVKIGDSEPYSLNSSPDSDELTILSPKTGRENGTYQYPDGVFGRGRDSDPYYLNSSQESDELTIFPPKKIDGGFRNSTLPRAELYCLNSSQESDELAIFPENKSKENGKIDGFRKSKKGKENVVLQKKHKKKLKSREVGLNSVSIGPTATLMETQEFGEMMEHVDEVNFAMDGLKKGQPVRVRRGSLLSLLSICGTAAQRRMLRAHGYFNWNYYS